MAQLPPAPSSIVVSDNDPLKNRAEHHYRHRHHGHHGHHHPAHGQKRDVHHDKGARHALRAESADKPSLATRVENLAENTLSRITDLVVSGTQIKRDKSGAPIVAHKHGHRVIEKKPETAFGGHCAGNVLGAMKQAGVPVVIANAKDAGASLKHAGFQKVTLGKADKPLAGDVMQIAPVGDHKNGHLAFYTGDPPQGCGWVSDAVQGSEKFPLRNVSAEMQAKHTTYFRHPVLAAQATQAQSTLIASSAPAPSDTKVSLQSTPVISRGFTPAA